MPVILLQILFVGASQARTLPDRAKQGEVGIRSREDFTIQQGDRSGAVRFEAILI
jgi:hypothetical protein